MAYQKKLKDVYMVQGYYCDEYGWETLTEEDTTKEAYEMLKCYNENEPMYRHRIKRRVERIEGGM